MHPTEGFNTEAKPTVWREISVGGGIYALRESRSTPQKSSLVSKKQIALCLLTLHKFSFFWVVSAHMLISYQMKNSIDFLDEIVIFSTYSVFMTCLSRAWNHCHAGLLYCFCDCFVQVKSEDNTLRDGTMIDLCGATLIWRSSSGLQTCPVSFLFLFLFSIHCQYQKFSS